MHRRRGVIFDLDGTLIDSLSAYRAALNEVFARYGVAIPYQSWERVLSSTYEQAIADIISDHGGSFPLTVVETSLAIDECYWKDHFPNVRIFPSAVTSLETARTCFGRVGLATASGRRTTERKMTRFNIALHFDITVTADDVRKHKPHPLHYRTAARRLGEKPETLLAVEDSAIGIRSALDAGFEVIGIAHHASEDELFSWGAHHTVKSHDELCLLMRTLRAHERH